MENLRALTFLSFIGFVYLAALASMLGWVKSKPIRWASLSMALFGLCCMAYGYFIEPYWPQVTRVQLTSPKVLNAVRLIHLSDIHSDPKTRLEDRIPELIRVEQPDIVLFTGDAINSPDGLRNFKRCVTRLAESTPTFAVQGNWDAWYWRHLDLYSGTGVRELRDQTTKVRVRNTDVWLAGVSVDGKEHAGKTLASLPPNVFTILLHHYPYPDILSDNDQNRVDLFCAGHVHGGQVALPFYGALITLSRWGKVYEQGLYRVGQMYLYVNRGIGMEGGSAPRVRFCSRPEITVIDILPQS